VNAGNPSERVRGRAESHAESSGTPTKRARLDDCNFQFNSLQHGYNPYINHSPSIDPTEIMGSRSSIFIPSSRSVRILSRRREKYVEWVNTFWQMFASTNWIKLLSFINRPHTPEQNIWLELWVGLRLRYYCLSTKICAFVNHLRVHILSIIDSFYFCSVVLLFQNPWVDFSTLYCLFTAKTRTQ